MAWKRRALRVAWITTLGFVIFILLALATIQGEQRLQRSRSERLLRQLQAIDLRVATFSDVERTFGRSATKSAKCDNESCEYSIQLESPLGSQALIRVLQRFHIPTDRLFHTLLRLGARPALVNAQIKIRNGIAWGKSMMVVIAMPGGRDNQGRWCDYELIGRVQSIPAFHHRYYRDAEFLLHTDYEIGRPGGCTACVEGHVWFTPYAAVGDVRRLMDFDLSCMTRWRNICRTQSDILPSAWAQYQQEESSFANSTGRPTPSPRFVETLGRDATTIAVVQIGNIDRHNEPNEFVEVDGHFQPTGKTYVEQRAKARVLQVLKGDLLHGGQDVTLQASEPELPFHDSEHLIVLLDPIWTEKADNLFVVESWQALPPTPENLDLIRTGMSEDFENGKAN